MSTRFFHIEERGLFMIGSIFPLCYPFQGISGWRKSIIRKHTWKWVAGCVLVGLLAGWFTGPVSARAFDWGLAAGALTRLRWPWLLSPWCSSSYLLRPGPCAGRCSSNHSNPGPPCAIMLVATVIGFTAITLFGRAGDLVRPYLIAVKEKVPVTSQISLLAAGAHFRPADGVPAVRVRAHPPATGFRRPCRAPAGMGLDVRG